MTDRQFQPDLTGSDETLEHLLDRLRSFSRRRPVRPGRNLPDWEFVTSRRPPRGAGGGAEAPLPKPESHADACAPS
ncbi:MAG: hypothetical protein ABI655_10620 [Phenylobacterium sp.]